MTERRTTGTLLALLVALASCASGTTASSRDSGPVAVPGVDQPLRTDDEPAPTGAPQATEAVTTNASPSSQTTVPPTTVPPTTVPPTTTSPEATTTTAPPDTTTTTTTVPELDVYDPACVMRIEPGDSLGLIAERFDDPTVTAASIAAENGIVDADLINAGSLLDVCVDNGLDDIAGAQRLGPNEAIEAAAGRDEVRAQQTKLNELFAGYGIRELLVDGISGPVTRQRLCAARVALGLPVSRADMESGSLEEVALMFAGELPAPRSSSLGAQRWVLIDLTCQIFFAGEGDSLTYVFPTSTGEAGYETRSQDRSRAFRYDPALQNGGWHNSTTFPVAIDNPLNGNMYRPIYFDGGQAIHGSNNVPTTPQSKGCARLRVADQDTLVAWLGLADLSAPTWSENRIGLRVSVQGDYGQA